MSNKYSWQTENNEDKRSGYSWDSWSIATQVGDNITKYVDTWMKNHGNYVANYQNRTKDRKYTFEDDYVNDPNDWLNTVSKQKQAFDASADSILAYMDRYKGYLDADFVKSVQDTLSGARSQQEIVISNATADSQWWRNFANENEYKTAQRYDGYSKKYTGQKYDDIQKALSLLDANSEEKRWLDQKQYDLYQNDKAYQSKALSGLKSYEAQKVAEKEQAENKTWWQSMAENYAYSSPDTSLPAANLSIVTAGYRNDTSYREPNDKWDEGQKRQFGYLYAEDPNKAYSYAEQVNNYINAQAAYLEQQAAVRNGTESFGSGALHTAGAIASAPLGLGLADYLDNIAELAGRGTITQKANLSPNEYFQAAQSGIADKLNEQSGTIDDDVWMLGGKGLGDIYNLGVAGAQSWATGKMFGAPAKGVGKAMGLTGKDLAAYVAKEASIPTLITYFGASGASSIDDAISRGVSPEKAVWYGTIMGAMEGAAEALSVDNLLKVGSASTFKSWLLGSMNQGLGELQEEGLTSLVDTFVDRWINGDKSKFSIAVKNYVDSGMSEEDAKKKAILDTAGDIAWDAMGGFATGFTNAGFEGATQTALDARRGNIDNVNALKDYGERTDALIQEGLQNDQKSESYKLAQKYQKQVQGVEAKDGKKGKEGKALTGFQIRNLLAANQEQLTAKDMQNIQKAAENRLVKLGQREDVSKVAELATKYATGGELTRAEKSFLSRSQYGSQVASELLPKNIMPGDNSGIGSDNLLSKWENDMSEGWGDNYSTEWAEDIGTKQVNAMAYNKKNIRAFLDQMASLGEDGPNGYKSLEERVGTESNYSVSDGGQDTIIESGKAIDLGKAKVVEFVRDKETGKVVDMVIDADGEKVKASGIAYADENKSYLFEAVGNIENITPEDATVVIRDYDPSSGLSVGEYLNGIDEGFTYGYHGYSEADLKAGNFAPKLSEAQANSAYVLGQNAKKLAGKNAVGAYKQMRTAAQAEAEKATAEGKEAPKAKKLTITYNHGGGVIEDIETARKKLGKLTDEQRGGMEAANILHQMGIGTDFELFTSYYSKTLKDKDGKPLEVFLNDEGQEEAAYAGVYRAADGKIRINLNAYSGTKGLTLNALSHELTHFIKTWSLEKYEAMAEFLVKAYGEKGVSMHRLVLKEQARLEGVRGKEVSYDEAYDEVVANAFNRMLEDGKVMERIAEIRQVDKSLADKIIDCIRKFIKRFMKVYKDNQSLFFETEALMEMKEVFEELQAMFAEALVDASDNFQAAQAIGFEMDAETESISPAVHSEQTRTESDYVKQRDKAAQEIANVIGVSDKKAKDYIDSVNSIAKMIAEDRSRLDYFSSPGRSSFVDNAEYGGSFDFSTLCKKRRLLTGTFTAIQKSLPNTALTANEILDIRNRMKEKGLEVSCGLCYVEGSRANMGQFAKEFLRLYKQYYPDAWQPNMADVNTPDGIEWVRINHPECYEQYEYFWNHYGTLKSGDKNLFASQQKPKLYQLHTEYKGEILNKFKNDDKVEDKNLNGGIRLQSFSDFEIVHLIDTMQIIMDMSRVGLAGQAYTKVPDFAWALGDTGLKINLSLIAKGVDANGRLIFDDVEGMPIAEAMKLRDRYSKNVGTILVAFNDEQLMAAMADDRVDFIIPFHRSQWKKSQYEAMGLPAKTKDYTFMQNEKYIKPQYHEYRGRMVKDKATNYMPNEYWDFSKSGKENAEAYLEMCARNNKRPKFYKLLQNNGDGSYSLKSDGSTDGYWKLLIDFKMYDNEGNGSPQMAVKPDFNMEEATRMLNDYSGGHSNFPVAQGIVDSFVKDYKASHKGEQYSSQQTDVDRESKAHPYSYTTMISKPDMVITEVDGNVPSNRADVVLAAKQNAANVGRLDPKTGSVSVRVDDIGEYVLIGTDGLKHGLRRTKNAQNDANYIVTLKAGEIIKHSIKINEANPKKQNAAGAYVLIGAARNTSGDLYIVRSVVNQFKNELASMDVLYAINAKKELAALNAPRSTAEPLSVTSSTISISKLLDLVNQHFPDILPEEVLKHYGHDARPEGDLGEDVLYSTQQTDNITNRHLLANAFEGIVQNSDEYKMIQQYKDHIAELNSLEAKLSDFNQQIRELRFDPDTERDAEKLARLEDEARKIAEAINKHDKKLLELEASEPLRKVIDRERKKAAQKTREHVNEIQQNKKLRAEQVELRHKIRKAVRDLDKILKHGNKQKNVKEEIQPVVTKALKAADILFTDNYGNYDMLRNGLSVDLSDAEEELVNTCTQMLKAIDKMPTDGYDSWQARQEAENRLKAKMGKLKDVFARERKRLNNTTVSEILGELADAYASLKDSEQGYVKGAYMEPVYEFLKSLQSEVSGTIVKDMTKDQLESVYAAYKMVLTTVRKANELFNKGIKMSREQLGNAVIGEVLKAGGTHGLWTKTEIAMNQASWNNMKPVWVANRIGSDSFGKLMQGLFEGQYNFAVDIEEAKQFKLSMDKKYHPRNWDAEKLYHFESSTGRKFSLNLQQIMSLYAFSKREQAYSHILSGGFVFEANSTVVVDKKGIKRTYLHDGATSYKLNEATLAEIIGSLTKEQKAYVDEMQAYLSDVMGAKGNEVSMKLYGIQMFKEKFYFPLRSSGAYMERAKEAEMKKQQGQINLVNSGFTHAVKPQAKNPIILSGFMDVWAEHCNEMSMYHSMVLPMEDFRKVYNYSTVHDEQFDSASVYQTIQDAYGKAATDYIDQLYRELNAGATVDPRETPFKARISKFKKAAVMLSASVVVQQFSSVGRAYALIDPKYFVGSKVKSGTNLSVADEMKKYAPVAIIKEMGGFDTGTKGSAKSYIMAEQYGKGERIQGLKKDEQYRSDIMGFFPAKADELTWCAIWEAVKRETRAKHNNMDVKSEAFLKLAGERFSEVIEKTQVYDSVLARSANMRSKGAFMNMATAFMAEPTTTINLLEDALRGRSVKKIARAFGAVAVSIVLNNALASAVYAMRDDDEDETFIEKYFQSFTAGMIDDINPMSYYPFLKDVYSLFQGYDVERADMSVIADLRDAMKKAVSLLGKDTSEMDEDELAAHWKNVNSVMMSLLDAGCSAFGVPVKNVRRDVNGVINAYNTIHTDITERDTTWMSFWDKVGAAAKDTVPIYAWTKDRTKADKLYEAIISGDQTYVGRIKATYKSDDAYHSAIRKLLRENDPRIHEAAQAKYKGNSTEYKRIFKEIQKEGKFSFDDIMEAINSEVSSIKKDLEPTSASSEYSSTDFVNAVLLGEARTAESMREDIVSTKVANGQTKEEAEESFASSVATATRNAFDSGLLNESGVAEILAKYAGMDDEEADAKVNYWAFVKAHPEYRDDLNQSRVEKYWEFAEPAEIPLDVFIQYANSTKNIETIYDEWGDEVKSAREQVLEVIDSLPLSWQQKNALYLAHGYAESKIWDVPW